MFWCSLRILATPDPNESGSQGRPGQSPAAWHRSTVSNVPCPGPAPLRTGPGVVTHWEVILHPGRSEGHSPS